MYEVRPASPVDLEAVIELITRLQADPAHLIAFHGQTAVEVTEELAGLRPDWASGAAVATDRSGRVRGVLSIDLGGGHRAFLHGPFVDVPVNHPAAAGLWHATADALLEAARRLPGMAGVTTLDLFGHRRNRLLADFAARHDVAENKAMRLFTVAGADLRAVLVRAVPDVADGLAPLAAEPEVRAAVARLHDRCLPGAPTDGETLVADDSRHTVVVLRGREGHVIGYAAGYSHAAEHYVDLVGVDPDVRCRGAGRRLVRRLLVELATFAGPRDQAAALVRLGNDASERMFASLGFAARTELVHYRTARTEAMP